jgi:hypothetical protein
VIPRSVSDPDTDRTFTQCCGSGAYLPLDPGSGGVSDPHHLNADPDQAFHSIADPDTSFNFNADPDPAPHKGDANLRPLAYRHSRPSF